MDTSLEELYDKHPVLRITEEDDVHMRSMKSELVMVMQMTPEEKAEWRRQEWQRDKERRIEYLIQDYHLNKSIKDQAIQFAKKAGNNIRLLIAQAEHSKPDNLDEYIEYIELQKGYIRTAKEAMASVDEAQRIVRNEIKEVRSSTYGTQSSRR